MENEVKPNETVVIRNDQGLFQNGTAPGPGRPKETEDERLRKIVLKKIIKEYEEKLTEILPDIPDVMKTEAKKGNMIAIKEINDRVLGKSLQRIGNPDGSNLTVEIINYGDIKRKIPTEELSDTNKPSV